MTPRIAAALLALTALSTGCHAKFKKNAPLIDEVRVQPLVVGGPEVTLGRMAGNPDGELDILDIAAVAVNTSQAIKEVNQEQRISQAVNLADVSENLRVGIEETLGSGPPFGTTADEAHGDLLQMEILSYGIFVPYLGAPGSFSFSARARIYRADGDRVYRNGMTCEGSLGDPGPAEIIFGTVNNVRALEEMSDAEINEAIAGMARYCGQQFAIKMRRHAG